MRTIDATELGRLMERERGWTLIDVLPEESYQKEHLPGAHNAPVSEPDFLDRVDDLVDSKDDHVIVYCASTDCDASPKAARKLEDEGYTNVTDFEGGLDEWKKSGFKVASGETAGSARS